MMAGKKKRPTVEEELAEIRALVSAPWTETSAARVREALGSPRSLVVARAARIVKDRALDGYMSELVAAFERFLENPNKTDPGCNAKLAALEALDVTNHMDPDPFLRAARVIQLEPAWGPPVDSAAPLRARAVFALAHQGYMDLLILCGELLADKEAPVRQAAAEAIEHAGDRSGAGLLLLMARRGDDDPIVHTAYLSGLLKLAPDFGLPVLERLLSGSDPSHREIAAIALGTSGREDALELLLKFMDGCPVSADRALVVRALGLHRSDLALEFLIGYIARGRPAEAAQALDALAPRRFEPKVRAQVERAVQESGSRELLARFQELFSRVDQDRT